MDWFGSYSVRMNGPLPTTGNCSSLLNSAKSSTSDQMCSGRMGTSSASIVTCGLANWTSTVCSSVAVTASKFSTKLPLASAAAGSVIIVLNVHSTSSAVTGSPSLQVASSRRWYVQVSSSSEVSHSSASAGIVSPVSGS